MLELHHDKHHKAYVDGLNTTMDKLEQVRASGDYSTIVGLQKTLAFNLSGHVLHSIFWKNLTSGEKPVSWRRRSTRAGSFDQFKDHLSQATTTVQGSGWGSLAWDTFGKQLYIEQIYDHQGNVGQSGSPLLVIDAGARLLPPST